MPSRARLGTRLLAILAVVLILITAVSDEATDFWALHPMIAAYVSGFLLLVVGVAVVNEWLSARDRARWLTVSALAITQLRDSSRVLLVTVSSELLDGEGPTANPRYLPPSARELAASGSDQISALVVQRLSESTARDSLGLCLRTALARCEPIAVTWAPVMIGNSETVDVLDRYVSLLNRLWRILWAVADEEVKDLRAPPPDAEVAHELADLYVDVADFQEELTAVIREVLPWPASFGERP